MGKHSTWARIFGEKKSLADELTEIFDSVVELRKEGLNEEDPDDPYAYLRIVDLCNAFRGELLQRGILFVPTDLGSTFDTVANSKGEDVERCTVRTSFELIRKTDRLYVGTAEGHAHGRSDKNLAIAQTAAFKAQLKRMAMIYGKEDDPEVNREQESPREAVRATSYQKRALDSAIKKSGLSYERLSEEFTKIMGFQIDAEQVASLPRENFEVVMKWLLAQGEDLSGTWGAAVEQAKAKREPQKVVAIMDRKASDEIAL